MNFEHATPESAAEPAGSDVAALLERVIDLAVENVARSREPFGSLVWRGGEVLGVGVNALHDDADPTSHAEVNAIRAAATLLGTPFLPGATVVTSCEPCVMCLAVAAAADVAHIVYAAPKELVPRLDGPERAHLPSMQDAVRALWAGTIRHVDHPRASEPFERYVRSRVDEQGRP